MAQITVSNVTNMLKDLTIENLDNQELAILMGTCAATPNRPDLKLYRNDMRTAISLTVQQMCETATVAEGVAERVVEKTRIIFLPSGDLTLTAPISVTNALKTTGVTCPAEDGTVIKITLVSIGSSTGRVSKNDCFWATIDDPPFATPEPEETRLEIVMRRFNTCGFHTLPDMIIFPKDDEGQSKGFTHVNFKFDADSFNLRLFQSNFKTIILGKAGETKIKFSKQFTDLTVRVCNCCLSDDGCIRMKQAGKAKVTTKRERDAAAAAFRDRMKKRMQPGAPSSSQ